VKVEPPKSKAAPHQDTAVVAGDFGGAVDLELADGRLLAAGEAARAVGGQVELVRGERLAANGTGCRSLGSRHESDTMLPRFGYAKVSLLPTPAFKLPLGTVSRTTSPAENCLIPNLCSIRVVPTSMMMPAGGRWNL
jgi:hypothetical protein